MPPISAERGRRDWYYAPQELWSWLRGVPGVQPAKGRSGYLIHRSHLVLLPDEFRPMLPLAIVDDRALDAETTPNGWTLRDYQYEGVAFVRSRRGAMLAWQMRTGKTPVTVAAHDLDHDGPLFVVAPLQARSVWLSWFARRWPAVKPTVLVGRKYDPTRLKNARIILCHYDVLAAHQTLRFGRIGRLVLDEAHLLSNHKSWRTQAAGLFAGISDNVVLLTGTPLWNRPKHFYQLLHLLTPGAWGGFPEYARRYCDAHPGEYGLVADGTSNEAEFQARLAEVYSRKRWQDVLGSMEPITRLATCVSVEESAAEQITLEAASLHKQTHTTVGDLATLRRLLGEVKLQTAIDRAREFMENGEPVVIWVHHRAIGKRITKAVANHAYLVLGETPVSDRDATLDAWRADPTGCLVISLGVGQTAIDLSHAAHAVFAEQDWTPAVVSQAEFRTFSPTRPMTVEYLVADHLVDRKIVDALVEKVARAQRLGLSAAETDMAQLQDALGGTGSTDSNYTPTLGDLLGGDYDALGGESR